MSELVSSQTNTKVTNIIKDTPPTSLAQIKEEHHQLDDDGLGQHISQDNSSEHTQSDDTFKIHNVQTQQTIIVPIDQK